MPPKTAATSSAISSRAAISPLGGLDSSSRCTSSSMRPPRRPPLALISSIASVKPRVIASPDCAEAPDRAATCPILIGSAANAEAIPHSASAPPITSERTALSRLDSHPFLISLLLSPGSAIRNDRRLCLPCQFAVLPCGRAHSLAGCDRRVTPPVGARQRDRCCSSNRASRGVPQMGTINLLPKGAKFRGVLRTSGYFPERSYREALRQLLGVAYFRCAGPQGIIKPVSRKNQAQPKAHSLPLVSLSITG